MTAMETIHAHREAQDETKTPIQVLFLALSLGVVGVTLAKGSAERPRWVLAAGLWIPPVAMKPRAVRWGRAFDTAQHQGSPSICLGHTQLSLAKMLWYG
jgi:hypothetical protein